MIIEPTLSSIGDFQISRADRITTPGQIDAQVIRRLLEDDLVIADLSMLNPNAFYEIGIRHMAQKPIIHMQLANERTPFDVSIYRSIKFSRERPSDIRLASQRLKEQVIAILKSDYEVENPITLARGRVLLEENASSDEKVLLSEIRSLSLRIEILEKSNMPSYNRISDIYRYGNDSRQLPYSMREISLAISVSQSSASKFPKFRSMISRIGRISLLEEGGDIIQVVIDVNDGFHPNEVLSVANEVFGEHAVVVI